MSDRIKMTLREIDAAVAERVMGWSPDDYRYRAVEVDGGCRLQIGVNMELSEAQSISDRHNNDLLIRCGRLGRMMPEVANIPEYSTDIAPAWEVFSHFAALGLLGFIKYDALRRDGECKWTVVFGNHERSDANSAQVAICLAALRAVGVDVEVSGE